MNLSRICTQVFILSTALTISLIAVRLFAFAGDEIVVGKAAKSEQYERDVDLVALSSQEQAISKLNTLLKKYRNTRQEPILLAKLAELQQQNASIIFRIAHGAAHRGQAKALDMSKYNKAQNQTISTLNVLIAKYPRYEEISRAYFMRGKSYEEIENKASAIRDYTYLVNQFPTAPETSSAYMSLAEFATLDNDHARAIKFLSAVEQRPEDPHYPFALYKLAWAHYNLKQIAASLSFAERHVEYYNKRIKGSEQPNTSDIALRDNTLFDIPVFYFEGYEQGQPKYPLSEALFYFKKLDGSPALGKMLYRFAKLLRSHGHDADLITWKDQLMISESDRPETLDVVITTFEHQLNKRRYNQLIASSQDIVKLYQKNPKLESMAKAQKLLLDTADGLQQVMIKNKDATEVSTFSVTLATIYDSFTRIVDEKDPRIPRVHYNLAETLFAIKDFPGATEHYRWIVERSSWDSKAIDVSNASLKAIASRYEVLKQKGLIPGEITARSLKDSKDSALEPLVAQWVEWIDSHVKKSTRETENFVFEANRTLYSSGHIEDAFERLSRFARKYPESKFAVPSATLVIDTAIATADWAKTREMASDFMKVEAWKKLDFGKKLFAIAADASYKLIEIRSKSHDYAGVLDLSDEFLKDYASSARLADALILSGNAALETAQKDRAAHYFSRLISDVKGSDAVGTALLARGQISEDKYQFAGAASDYRSYLSLPAAFVKAKPADLEALRKKTLMLSWLAGDIAEMRATLQAQSVCTEALAKECEKYSAIVAMETGSIEGAFDKARKSTDELRTLWASLALEGTKELPFRDRLLMVRFVASGWDELDPILKFSLVPRLSVILPKAFQMNRMAMREVAPLRADERYITRRIEVIREMENAATKAMKLPWSRIRADVMNEIAGLYLDLSRELSGLPAPKGLAGAELSAYEDTVRKLVMPFEEKGQEMRAKAFEMASQSGVEERVLSAIAEPFFAENPSQAKLLKAQLESMPQAPREAMSELNIEFLEHADSSSDWASLKQVKKLPKFEKDPSQYLKALWAQAIAAQRWQQIAFFTHEAESKALVQAGVVGLMKAVSFSVAGARGEALAELVEARRDMPTSTKTLVTLTLAQQLGHSFARQKAKELLKELPAEALSSEQAAWVALLTEKPAPENRAPATQSVTQPIKKTSKP